VEQAGQRVVAVGGAGQLQHVGHAVHVGAAGLGQRDGQAQVGGGVDDVGEAAGQGLPGGRLQTEPGCPDVAGQDRHPAAPTVTGQRGCSPTDLLGQLRPVPPGPQQPAAGRRLVRGVDQRHQVVVGPLEQPAGDLGAQEPGGAGEQDHAAHAGSPAQPWSRANAASSARLRRAAAAWTW
jgi:hypothetical protein